MAIPLASVHGELFAGGSSTTPCVHALQAAFHSSIAKWLVLNSKRAVTVLHPNRIGHHKAFVLKHGHPAGKAQLRVQSDSA